MHEVALDLLILLGGIWLIAVTLRPVGLPTVMGELIVGVLLGPAVFGIIEPGEAIQLLAEIGIFFLMFHAGVETQPLEFYDALKRSLGVALVGAIVPFSVSFGIAWLFGMDLIGATFVGLTMTATAVVITLTSLKDLGLANTRVARVIVASCVIDNLLTLVFFGLVIGVLSGGTFEPLDILVTLGKVIAFFAVALLVGRYLYPRLKLPFHSKGGKGFTFVLFTAIGAGLFAEAIGLHMILGAYLAGLFFEDQVAHPNLVRIVKDRAYGIAYSFLGPIFFMSLGFSITFDISASGVVFIILLTVAVIVGQILSAGAMAMRIGMPVREALTVGVGMCGRAEMAFILAALALSQGAIDQTIFTALILVAFLLNLFTPLALKGCAAMLEGQAAPQADATAGIIQIDTFGEPLVDERYESHPLQALPDVENAVVIFGYDAAVDSLIGEIDDRGVPLVVIEEDEAVAERLHARGQCVVHASLAEDDLDLAPLASARALVANGPDENDALLAMSARDMGFRGPIVALIDNPHRRAPMQLAGVTAAFTPNHVLAAAVAVRASTGIGERITGIEPLGQPFEVAEVRVHDSSPLANVSLGEAGVHASTGAHIVGQWLDDDLHPPPVAEDVLLPGMILVAAGTPESIKRLEDLVRPLPQEGAIVVVGYGDVGTKIVEMLMDAGEEVCTVDEVAQSGVDVVGDVLDPAILRSAGVVDARVVILACEGDNATLLVATGVRSFAADVPIIACIDLAENVARVQRAGADFTFSVGQVAGQLLAYHVLGEMVSQQARIKVGRLGANGLVGHHPLDSDIRDRTGCAIVAVERGGEVIGEIPASFVLEDTDAIYVCGTVAAFNGFSDNFAQAPEVA
ncbi:MAG: cation:proton antiporter [Pseudomonadales bacterium]|jgi:Kef-type K+ transport system membrane component KefB/Trk K+ transport system NAD-binding subunit|nr:cation:proton antiporter [Pseudomonadales bacterium]MDP6470179.1 cation:proton antiporter [Pseudomonadales bacterium]MDP6827085.1 cation:proton antiporter [Pseudomonadales bacterium]MDP6972757.1 cation:proton antiporter [Pseudomonadales bacterium]